MTHDLETRVAALEARFRLAEEMTPGACDCDGFKVRLVQAAEDIAERDAEIARLRAVVDAAALYVGAWDAEIRPDLAKRDLIRAVRAYQTSEHARGVPNPASPATPPASGDLSPGGGSEEPGTTSGEGVSISGAYEGEDALLALGYSRGLAKAAEELRSFRDSEYAECEGTEVGYRAISKCIDHLTAIAGKL